MLTEMCTQVDWISAKLADTAEPIDLRVNCAEALGAVASANQDGASMVQPKGTVVLACCAASLSYGTITDVWCE